MESDNPRTALAQLIANSGDTYAAISLMLGKNSAYIQQYLKRGTPRKLDEADRRILAEYFGVAEALLGGRDSSTQEKSSATLIEVKQFLIGASAGPGAIAGEEIASEAIGFAPQWLRRMGADPGALSLITVSGDSMEPTLANGDDIMIDARASQRPLRDGIHVLRADDVLLVKRIAIAPGGKLNIRSDNSAYPDWNDVDPATIDIIGRVIWVGKRI